MKIVYLLLSPFVLFFCFFMACMDDGKKELSWAIPSRQITIGNESGRPLTLFTIRPDPGFAGGYTVVKERSELRENGVVTLLVTKSELLGSLLTFKYDKRAFRFVIKGKDGVLHVTKALEDSFGVASSKGKESIFLLSEKCPLFNLDE